jgi:urease subunit gamma/beta
MRLTDWERERLLIFAAAELARRHRSAGLLLNAPEATALICDAMLEAARAGQPYRDIERAGRDAVRASECLEGIPALVSEIRLEVLMDEGTRLVVLLDPIDRATEALVPGEVVLSSEPLPAPADRPRRRLSVRNDSRRTIHVSSHHPFHLVNVRLAFDRAAAHGFRLDLPAGETLGWAPGEEREVALVAYGGEQNDGVGDQVDGGAG